MNDHNDKQDERIVPCVPIFDFDSVTIQLSTYIFIVFAAFRWVCLGFAIFSFSSFFWFDQPIAWRICITAWFLFACASFVTFIQKLTLESILALKNKDKNVRN